MKAEQVEGWVKSSDMRTVNASQSFRTLAVVVRPGWNVGQWHTPSASYAQRPKCKGLRAPEEQDLGKPPPVSLH